MLKIKDLTIHLGPDKTLTTPLLDAFSMNLKTGGSVGIIGESGSGKSITALSIMGLLNPKIFSVTQGSINYRGDNLLKLPSKRWRSLRGDKIAMVFQEPMSALNPSKKCGKQIDEVLKTHTLLKGKERKKTIIKLLEDMSLSNPSHIYKSYPHQISGGQKQRVVISMALVCNPEILIADEPTTALDMKTQKEIVDLLLNIQKVRNMGLIFISHDLGLVSRITEDLLILKKGKIVEAGKSDHIFRNPQHPYTKALLNTIPKNGERPLKLATIDDFEKKESAQELLENIAEHDQETLRKQEHLFMYSQHPILRICNLSKSYDEGSYFGLKPSKTKILKEINLDLYPGETVGIVGESGCGKSTLAYSILGIEKIDEGLFVFGNTPINYKWQKFIKKHRTEIQLIFQDPYDSLNPKISVGKSIVEIMSVHGLFGNHKKRKRKALSLLGDVGLGEAYFDRLPSQLSGGQRQRIGIAKALVLSPKILVCDEVVSALDVAIQAQVLNLLNRLRKKYNFACLFISHDLKVVRYMSDRIAVMKKGRIVELEEADKLCVTPQHRYTKQLVSLAF